MPYQHSDDNLRDCLLRGSVKDAKALMSEINFSREHIHRDAMFATSSLLERGSFELAKRVAYEFGIRGGEFRKCVFEAVLQRILHDDITTAQDISVEFPLPRREVQRRVVYELERALQRAHLKMVFGLVNVFELTKEDLQSAGVREAANRGMGVCLLEGRNEDFLCLLWSFSPERIFSVTPDLTEKADAKLLQALDTGDYSTFSKIRRGFAYQPEKLRDMQAPTRAAKGIKCALANGRVRDAIELQSFFEIEANMDQWLQIASPGLVNLIKNFELTTIGKLRKFVTSQDEFVNWCLVNQENVPLLTKDIARSLENVSLSMLEAENILRQGIDLLSLINARNYEQIGISLLSTGSFTKDAVDNFHKLVDVFGWQSALYFSHRRDINRNTALSATEDILRIFSISKLDSRQFDTKILRQISDDYSSYREGNSIDHFRKLSQKEYLPLSELKSRAIQSVFPSQIVKMIERFDCDNMAFSSWKKLKAYFDLLDIIQNQHLRRGLENLGHLRSLSIRKYIESVLLHPGINVEESVNILLNPQKFFEAEDEDTKPAIHRMRSAERLLEVPFLALTASDLTAAIASSSVASLSLLPTHSIEMQLSIESESNSVRDRLQEALGSESGGIVPKALKPKFLYHQVKSVLKANGQSIQDYLTGLEIDTEIESRIDSLIRNPEFGVPSRYVTVVATLHSKDDPLGALAGDDTVSCRTYPKGKNIHYMLNPGVVFFTVAIKDSEENLGRKVLAESVITPVLNIERRMSEVLPIIESNDCDIDSVTSIENLSGQLTILCDNRQISRGYDREPYFSLVERAYKKFFIDYFSKFAQLANFDTSRILIGEGYSEQTFGFAEIDNTFLPLSPVTYTDNRGPKTLVQELSTSPVAHVEASRQVGVLPLTWQDSLALSHLEARSFPHELRVHHAAIQMGLIAKDISNKLKNKPEMSFKFCDGQGIFRGYLMAYEGVVPLTLNLGSSAVIYVSGLAVDKVSATAASRLMNAFVASYKENYLDQNNPVEIYAELREKTSLKILSKHFTRLAKESGLNLEMIELGAQKVADEVMHRVLITTDRNSKLVMEFLSSESPKTTQTLSRWQSMIAWLRDKALRQ